MWEVTDDFVCLSLLSLGLCLGRVGAVQASQPRKAVPAASQCKCPARVVI
jgi:hypothetical protein